MTYVSVVILVRHFSFAATHIVLENDKSNFNPCKEVLAEFFEKKRIENLWVIVRKLVFPFHPFPYLLGK